MHDQLRGNPWSDFKMNSRIKVSWSKDVFLDLLPRPGNRVPLLVRKIASLRFPLFFAGLLALLIGTNPSLTLAQSVKNQEEAANLGFEVERNGENVPIDEVAALRKNDILKIDIEPKLVLGGGSFSDSKYVRLIVMFVPLRYDAIAGLKYPGAVQKRKLDASKPVNNTDDGFCFKGCKFPVSVEYDSFPVVFLVSRGGYTKDLRNLFSNESQHSEIMKFGALLDEFSIPARTFSFLTEVGEVVAKASPATDTKVLRSLVDRAFLTIEQGGLGLGLSSDGTPLKDKVTGAECRTIGSQSSAFEKHKSQLGCLLGNYEDVVKKLDFFKQRGLKASAKEVGLLLVSEGISQMLNKFPSLNNYLGLIKIAVELIARFFEKPGLVVSPGFITRIDSSKTSGRVLFSLFRSKNLGDKVNGSPDREKALLFAPIRPRSQWDVKDVLSKLRDEKLEAVAPCIEPERNVFRFGNPTLFDEPGVKVDFKVTNTEQPIVRKGEVSFANQGVSIDLSDSWKDLDKWGEVTLHPILKFDGVEVSAPVIRLQVPKGNEFNPTDESKREFTLGNKQLVLKGSLPNCVKDASFNIAGVIRPASRVSVDEIEFNPTDFSSVKPGPGKLLIAQYGGRTKEYDVILNDPLPTLDLVAYSNDVEISVIKGERTALIDASKPGVLLDQSDQKIGELSWVHETNVLSLRNGRLPQRGSRVRVQLQLTDGRVFRSNDIEVKPIRPSFLQTSDCLVDVEKAIKAAGKIPPEFEITKGKPECYANDRDDVVRFYLYPDSQDYSFSLASTNEFRLRFKAGFVNESISGDRSDTQTVYPEDDRKLQIEVDLRKTIKSNSLLGRKDYFAYVQLVDSSRGASDWYRLGLYFLSLPKNLELRCKSDGSECSIEKDIKPISQVSLDGENWTEIPDLAISKSVEGVLMSDDKGDYFFIKLKKVDIPIKVRASSGGSDLVKITRSQALSPSP